MESIVNILAKKNVGSSAGFGFKAFGMSNDWFNLVQNPRIRLEHESNARRSRLLLSRAH